MATRKVLFTTDKYYPRPYANGVCMQLIAEEFLSHGDAVDVLCYRDRENRVPHEFHGCRVFPINPSWRERCFYRAAEAKNPFVKRWHWALGKVLSFFAFLLFFRIGPYRNPVFHRRLAREILALHRKNDYDAIITVCSPIDGPAAMIRLKKKGLIDCPWLVYTLDTLASAPHFLLQKERKPSVWYRRITKVCDAYFIMASRMEKTAEALGPELSKKLVSVDIPFRYDEQPPVEGERLLPSDAENWCYFGSLGGADYPPEDCFAFFAALPADKKRVLHLFTRSAHVPFPPFPSESNKAIVYHDYVDQKTLRKLLGEADVFVSIKYTAQISAKYYDYFSTGKPVVHFSGHPHDPDISYMNRYPNAVCIITLRGAPRDWVDEYLRSCTQFRHVEIKEVVEAFVENSPGYTYDRMSAFIPFREKHS